MRRLFLTTITTIVALAAAHAAFAEEQGNIGAFPGWTYPAIQLAIADMNAHAPDIDLEDCVVTVSRYAENLSVSFYDKDSYGKQEGVLDTELYSVILYIDGFRIVYRSPVE